MKSAVSEEMPKASAVTKIEVADLYGSYNYNLDLAGESVEDRLTLLYGENGSGKTTILELVWNLLSPSDRSGHRTRVSRIAFTRVTVHLGKSITISALRKLPVAGPYTIEVRKRGRLDSRSTWPEKHAWEDFFEAWTLQDFDKRLPSMDADVQFAGKAVQQQRKYIELLDKLGSAPYFLADDRSTSSDAFAEDPASSRARSQFAYPPDLPTDKVRPLALELEKSIRRVNEMLRQLAIGGNTSGSANANSVYLDVLGQIGSMSSDTAKDTIETQRQRLMEQIVDLGKRSRSFEELGLTPRFAGAEFSKTLRNMETGQFRIAKSILEPYIESLSARLDALQDAESIIRTFLTETNGYLTNKSLRFSPRSGLRILLEDGKPLRPRHLSSGESHLVLLLCNALLAREGSRLFLIDEPELSLNVKWQRRVVRSLLACTEGSGVQFVIATHSIELLSAFRKNVVRMQQDDEYE
ncbi:DNA replication and repair protein RecF [Arthrobacter sp. SO5]|nr:DNA replication and repair protein RecF [Arthrobacter sp. SO5]